MHLRGALVVGLSVLGAVLVVTAPGAADAPMRLAQADGGGPALPGGYSALIQRGIVMNPAQRFPNVGPPARDGLGLTIPGTQEERYPDVAPPVHPTPPVGNGPRTGTACNPLCLAIGPDYCAKHPQTCYR